MAYGSGPTVHLYPDRPPLQPSRRRSTGVPLLLGLGIPVVLLAVGGLLLGGDQPTKKGQRKTKHTTTPAAREAPAPKPAHAQPPRAAKPPPGALGKPTAKPTLSPAEEKAQQEAWRKREREMLRKEREMIESLGD